MKKCYTYNIINTGNFYYRFVFLYNRKKLQPDYLINLNLATVINVKELNKLHL